MEVQDGITVRPMRLKVLYTFDDQSKTNCLARWPHLLDIQTAHIDEKTQIGVIELKTCIQAIVSASPELVAKLGQDYTVYAYDYSEYETPLVGQGMLSWVLASASPTPNAPAHQSKTIVTGRVSKGVLGLFSKGAQETLEVKLRLVPVPTLMQSEYLESMQRYRELSNVIPQNFDAQTWSTFVQQNPQMFAPSPRAQSVHPTNGSVDHSGIERFHRLLSEGSTPREFPSNHPDSAATSPVNPPSRSQTPLGMQMTTHTSRQQPVAGHSRRGSEVSIRPLSRASVHESDFQRPGTMNRRGSIGSGYGSGDEQLDHPPRKRARLFKADVTGKDDLNIERQPGSLRVAASTAASVRIHRPTPISSIPPSVATGSLEEPVRPPTPISRASTEGLRRSRPAPSLLRESSHNSASSYRSSYAAYDDVPSTDLPETSPDDHRYQGIFESQLTMPSSPPVMDAALHNRSSPVLPPLSLQPDSGFMSASLEELMEEDGCIRTNYNENSAPTGMGDDSLVDLNAQNQATNYHNNSKHVSYPGQHTEDYSLDDAAYKSSTTKDTPTLPPQHSSNASRSTSRTSIRPAQKLAPAPLSQSEIEQLMSSIPASDPILPPGTTSHANVWSGPMSDMPTAETPLPQSSNGEDRGKGRSGAGARRVRQVQARLEHCIREGQVPPYCYNCGAIETPTWRRAWSKHYDGNEEDANEFLKDPMCLFWTAIDRVEGELVTKFRLFKKTLGDTDKDFDQILLCNPCGLWLQKFKCMRPENKWNKQPAKDKRKRSSRPRKGPLTNGAAASTRSRSRSQMNSVAGSSPANTDTSSPAGDNGSQAGDDGNTPAVDNDNEPADAGDSMERDHPNKRLRASSAEPTSNTVRSRWDANAAVEALERAIQSSPARNLEVMSKLNDEKLTPKPVRRALFPQGNSDGPLKTLGESLLNSPRRSPRVASRGSEKTVADKENSTPATNRDLDDLFESPSFEFSSKTTPTPKRRSPRTSERRLSLPFCSPSANRTKQTTSSLSPSTPRSRQTRSTRNEEVSVDNDDRNASAFPSVDDIGLDNLFDPWSSLPQTDMFIPFSNWSPSAHNSGSMLQFSSGFNDDEALINAVLAESEGAGNTELSTSFVENATVQDTTVSPPQTN